MLRNRKIAVLFAVLAAVAVMPLAVQASTIITNTGYVDYQNEASVAMTQGYGTTAFVVAANPVLSVVKTRNVGRGPLGTIVTYKIKVTYPQLGTDCTDDSDALNVVIRDTLPANIPFYSGGGSVFRVSYDNEGTWTNLTTGVDGDAGDVDTAGTNRMVTVKLVGNIPEGAGACVAGTARVIEYTAIVQ